MIRIVSKRTTRLVLAACSTALIYGCGGGSGGGNSLPPNGTNPPTATNVCVKTAFNTEHTGALPASDPDGQSLTFEVLTLPAKGSLTTDAAGQYRYMPRTNVRGMDKITFRARDSTGRESNVATVTFLIDGAVRIMPLGDSITVGTLTASTPPPGQSVGYRRKLYSDLTALGGNRYGVDFVGSQSEGQSASPPVGDANHEGHGGACAGPTCNSPYPALSSGIQGWLDSNSADIILLHAGINDLNQRGDTSASGIRTILDQIAAWESTHHPVMVYVARIIKDVPGFETNLPVQAFNDNVAAIVSARASERVVLVDMENGAGLNYGNGQPGPDMADNYHPSAAGYDKMAAKWYADLTNNRGTLPECQ